MYREDVDTIFKYLGLEIPKGSHDITTPIDGSIIGTVDYAYKEAIDIAIRKSDQAFDGWKEVPAPRRGELIRLFAEQLRKYKNSLGTLVSIETGKILQEGEGVLMTAGKTYFSVGGAVTWDSVPADELAELEAKGKAVFAALRGDQ